MPEPMLPVSAFLPGIPEEWRLRIREGHRTTPAYRIRILPEGILEVTAPRGADIASYLHRHRRWINRQVEETIRIATEAGRHEDLFLLDGTYRNLIQGLDCRIEDTEVQYDSPNRLREMLIDRLREDIGARIQQGFPLVGRSPNHIAIRMQRCRWASCSIQGNLNFNLTMMALPPVLRDYIVLHELCHLMEPNHSPAFWRLLEEFSPDCQQRKRELKRYHVLVERNRVWAVIRAIP